MKKKVVEERRREKAMHRHGEGEREALWPGRAHLRVGMERYSPGGWWENLRVWLPGPTLAGGILGRWRGLHVRLQIPQLKEESHLALFLTLSYQYLLCFKSHLIMMVYISYLLIEVELIYNIMFIIAIQHSDSVIYIIYNIIKYN